MPSGVGRHHPYKLYGVVLLAVIAGLVTLSVLMFRQTFTPFDRVTVHVAQAGLQLLPGSDVKVRGVIVGSVDSITSTGDGADLRLRLDPSRVRTLPRNVTVRMLPKTVFGEKYVDLVLPPHPAPQHLADGSVIAEDQTRSTLEIDQALNDLLPVLRTVPPVQLNHTLTALGSALAGRGEQLGRTMTQLDHYLTRFDPHLPQLHHDLSALAGVTNTYATAAGPLLHTLNNLSVTSRTLVDERTQLREFLADVTGTAAETRDLLARNAHNVIAVNRVSRPVIRLLARYSPEYPCFFKGYAGLVPRIHDAVSQKPGINHSAHVVVEFVPTFPTYSRSLDLPEFGDKRGPSCYGLPNPPMSLPVVHYKDGTQDDPRFLAQGKVPPRQRPATSPSMGSAGTTEERKALNSLLAPVYGVRSGDLPDIADLLWGPLLRGSVVNLQ